MATSTNGTHVLPDTAYGFIGIGVMGWGMAQNLRRKMPKSSTLVICELNRRRRDEFASDTDGLLKIVESPKEVAEQAVNLHIFQIWNLHSNVI
jgi:3-hydroxyisobutyrate dehydrogenase